MKLTIAIPTYNRASYLDKCLLSLYDNYNKDFEILIYDNNSVDNTYEIVNNHISNGLPIKYIKNRKNLGWAKNFELCFKGVTTEYMILLGDDDIIFNNSVSNILNEIKSYRPELIFLKALPLKTLDKNRVITNSGFNNCGRNEFLHETILQFRLISSYVIKTKHLKNISCFSGNFAHLEVVFENLRKGKNFSVSKGYYIGSLVNNSDFNNKVKFSDIYVVEFFNLFRKNLKNILPVDEMIKIENKMLKLYYPKQIVKSRLGFLPYDEKVKLNFELIFSSNNFYNKWKFLILRENLFTTLLLMFYATFTRLTLKTKVFFSSC